MPTILKHRNFLTRVCVSSLLLITMRLRALSATPPNSIQIWLWPTGVSPSRLAPTTTILLIPTGSSRRSEEHTSELQSHSDLVCRLLLGTQTTHVRTASR